VIKTVLKVSFGTLGIPTELPTHIRPRILNAITSVISQHCDFLHTVGYTYFCSSSITVLSSYTSYQKESWNKPFMLP